VCRPKTAATSNVFVAGLGGEIIHRTTSGWFTEVSGVSTVLRAASGQGPNGVYAVGDGGIILHSAGSGTWTTLVSGMSTDLAGVWVADDGQASRAPHPPKC
jgi:hypothetical protein